MKYRKRILLFLVLSFLLAGCGSPKQEPLSFGPDEAHKLTVYVSHKEPVYLPIIREFEERTGIWVHVVTGGTNELLGRIEAEKGDPAADVIFGGGVESLAAYRDCFSPYISAEAGSLSDSYTDDQSGWTPFSALPVVLIYNPKLVDSTELQSWSDLLRPGFKGKIAFADPAVSGSSFTSLVTEITALKGRTADPMAAFAEALDGHILPDSGNVTSDVSSGKSLVGITLEETALKAIDAGEHIEIVYPSDGTTCLPDGIALIRNCPHPENAKLFLDFAVSRDAQRILVTQNSRRSVRTDVADSLPPLSEIPLLTYDIDRVCEARESILKKWAGLTEETV